MLTNRFESKTVVLDDVNGIDTLPMLHLCGFALSTE